MKPNFESKIFQYAIGGAVIEVLYIWFISWLIPKLEGVTAQQSILPFMLVLMIFVFSAGLSAVLVFGYTIYLLSQKEYRLAVLHVIVSLASLLIAALIVVSLTIF